MSKFNFTPCVLWLVGPMSCCSVRFMRCDAKWITVCEPPPLLRFYDSWMRCSFTRLLTAPDYSGEWQSKNWMNIAASNNFIGHALRCQQIPSFCLYSENSIQSARRMWTSFLWALIKIRNNSDTGYLFFAFFFLFWNSRGQTTDKHWKKKRLCDDPKGDSGSSGQLKNGQILLTAIPLKLITKNFSEMPSNSFATWHHN